MKTKRLAILATFVCVAAILGACSNGTSSDISSESTLIEESADSASEDISSEESSADESSDQDISSEESSSEESSSEESSSGDPSSDNSGSENTPDEPSVSSYSVYVNADAEIVSYEITGTANEDGTYNEGEKLSISVSVIDDGYTLSNIEADTASLSDLVISNTSGSASFVMPSADVNLIISTNVVEPEVLYTVSVDCNSSIASYVLSGVDDNNQAVAGTEVTLSVTVKNDEYVITSISSDQVTLEVENSESSATAVFTVPANDVSISVEFGDSGKYFSVTEVSIYITTSTYLYSPNISAGDKFEPGEEVTFSFKSSRAYSLINSFFISINGVSHHPETYTTYSSYYLYSLTFTMPSEDVAIKCTYYATTGESTAYTVTVQCNDGENTTVGSDDHITVMNPVEGAMWKSSASFYLIFVRDAYAVIENVTYEFPNTTTSGGTVTKFSNLSGDTTSGKRTSSALSVKADMLVTINYKVQTPSTITFVNDDDIEYTSSSNFDIQMPAGETANIYYQGTNDKYISGAATIEGVAESNISKNQQGGTTASPSEWYYIKYTVPSNDVTITYHTGDRVKFTFEENEYLEDFYIGSHLETGMPGINYNVFAVAKDGYVVSEIAVGDDVYTELTVKEQSYYKKISCPSTDVTIKATVVGAYTASTSIDSQYATVKFGNIESLATYSPEASVTFTITPTSGYVVDLSSISLVNSSEEAVNFTLDESSTYTSVTGTFTMPEDSVVLDADFFSVVDLSLNISDASAITSIQISGALSESYLSDSVTSASFYETEQLTIIAIYSTDYVVNMYTVDSDGNEVLIEPLSNADGAYLATLTVSASYTGIKVTVAAAEETPAE